MNSLECQSMIVKDKQRVKHHFTTFSSVLGFKEQTTGCHRHCHCHCQLQASLCGQVEANLYFTRRVVKREEEKSYSQNFYHSHHKGEKQLQNCTLCYCVIIRKMMRRCFLSDLTGLIFSNCVTVQWGRAEALNGNGNDSDVLNSQLRVGPSRSSAICSQSAPLLSAPDLLSSLFLLIQIFDVIPHPCLVFGVGDAQLPSDLCNERSSADIAASSSFLNVVAYNDLERQGLLGHRQTAVNYDLTSCKPNADDTQQEENCNARGHVSGSSL